MRLSFPVTSLLSLFSILTISCLVLASCAEDEEVFQDEELVLEDLEEAMLDFETLEPSSLSQAAPELEILGPDSQPVGNLLYQHNTIYTAVFNPPGPDYCRFHFFFGNYGAGYAWIKFDANPGCGRVTSYVVTHNGQFHDDYKGTSSPGVWAKASPGVGNILQASYCIESHYWGNRILVFNALTRQLEQFYTNPGDTC